MRRRQALLSLPIVGSLPGCVSGWVSPDADSPPVRLRAARRYIAEDDALFVTTPDAAQFAFIEPPTSAPPPDAFTLELGDERFSPDSHPLGREAMPTIDVLYTEASRGGWLVFDVPTSETTRGALIYDDTRYPLSDETISAVAVTPELTVSAIAVPDSVPADDTIEISVTVHNDGGREGVFLAGVQRGGQYTALETNISAGDSEDLSARLSVYADAGEVEQFRFVSPGEEWSYEIPVKTAE